MPRLRKPTIAHELSGAYKHDPQRRAARVNEPTPEGELGKPPKYFTKEQKKIWRELTDMVTPGWLTCAERWSVEITVVLMSRFRDGTIKTMEISALNSLMSKLGMTPSDRSRVQVPKKAKAESEWADFVNDPAEDHVTQ